MDRSDCLCLPCVPEPKPSAQADNNVNKDCTVAIYLYDDDNDYGFKNIFTEDKDTEIRPLPRKVFEYIFTCVKRACYQFLVFTIGFLLMFVYGLLFAVYSFSVAWIMNPILRSCLLFLGPCIKLPVQIMVMACAPCTDHLVKAIQRICPQRWYREEH